MAFQGKLSDKKIVINDKTIEKVQNFNYLDCDISYS
jgi:hypothetical protein